MATIAELRDAYPDFLQDKSDTDIVRMLAEKDGLSLPYVAYELGLDPAEWQQNESAWDDLGTSVNLGYEQTKRGIAHLPNVVSGLLTGENLYETPGLDNTIQRIQSTFSPGYYENQQAQGNAWDEGRYGDYAVGLVTTPYLANQALQSLPTMAGGGLLGMGLRGAAALGALGRGALARGVSTAAPYIGEGAVSTGYGYKNLIDEGVDPQTAAAASLAMGTGVGAVSGASGALANRMGYVDPERMFAGMGRRVGDNTVPLSYKGQIGYGLLAETGEEALQSSWEEAMSNVAQGKPWDENLGRVAIEGGLAGGMIGGGVNALTPTLRRKIDSNTPTDLLADDQQAGAEPLGMNPPGNQSPNIDPLAAARQRQIDAIMGGETSQTILPGQADPGSLQGLTREQINQRLIDAAMGGETARTFAPGQYPSDVAADLSQQQAKVDATRAAEQAKKAVEKQYEKAGWQKTPEKIALLEAAQAPKLVSGIYGDEARKFVDSVLTMDAKTAGELFTNLSNSTNKSAPWKAAVAKAHLTNLAQQEAERLQQQAADTGQPNPDTSTEADAETGTNPDVKGGTAATTSITPPEGVNVVPENGSPPVVVTSADPSLLSNEEFFNGPVPSYPGNSPTPANLSPVPVAPRTLPSGATITVAEQGLNLIHGSPTPLTLDQIDVNRTLTKGGKKGRSYGGFYAYEDTPEYQEYARRYADRPETPTQPAVTGVLNEVKIAPGANVLTLPDGADVTRLNQETRDAYRAMGVDVITGKGPLGKVEWNVINKDVIQSVGPKQPSSSVSPTTQETLTNALSGQTTPQAGQETGTTAPAPPVPGVTNDLVGKRVTYKRSSFGIDQEYEGIVDSIDDNGNAVLRPVGKDGNPLSLPPFYARASDLVVLDQPGDTNANTSPIQSDQETVPVPGAAAPGVQVQGSGNRELPAQQGEQATDAGQTQGEVAAAPQAPPKPNLKRGGQTQQRSGNTVADVERWIAGPKAKLAQWVTNGLNVVQSVDELRARYPGMDIPDDVVGMHEGGYVFLVADNITNANQARKALAHEVVGHLGLERMLGKKGFERIVRQIDSYIRTQNPAVLKALERVKAKYTDEQGKYNLNQVQEASEILAHLAEVNPNFGLIREILARLRMWFAKHGLGNYAAAELNQLLVEAARFTETGFTSFAEGNFRVAPAYMVAGGRPTQRSGVNAEVAPDPRRIKAGGDQTLQRWAELTYDDQLAITQTLGDSILPRLLQQIGAQDYRVEYTMGGFKGASNPSITIHFGQNVPYDLELEVANALGVLWRQQAMIAYNEDDTSTGDQVQFVKVIPDRKLSVQEQRDLFANINRLYPQAEGVSTRDGALVFGNFVGATEREFHEGVRDAFNQLETKYNAEIPSFVFRSDWIEPPTLENTDYGQSYNTQTASGRDVLRRRQRNFDSLQSESDALFKAAVDATWQRGRRPNAGRDERAGGRDTESRYPVYGTTRDKAVRAVGVHFSQTERQELDSSYYGTGLQGKEAQRVFAAADQRLRQRVYFYVNSGAGITPEAGVGGHAHTVALNNLYDLNADPLRLLDLPTSTNANENTNLVESAILDAGFDGYVSDFGKQRAAVLIGRHTVPVRYEGMTKPEVPAGERAVPNDIKRIAAILGKTWVRRTPIGFRKILMREDLGLYQAYADAFTGTGRTYWPDEMVREISKAYLPQREEQAAQPLPETITIDGVERPTTNSEGKPIHPTEAGVRNFWKWFAGSQVVDDQGRPLVVYHGTNAEFDTFDINKAGSATDEGWAGKGFYFHIDPDTSAIFGKNNMAVYLNMRNPYDFEGQNFHKVVQEKGGPSEFSKWLDKNGYDGAMLWGQRMVLENTQIKSATDNVGTFDGANPNINFMRGPTKQDATNLWDWIKTETEAGIEAFSRKVGLGALTNEQMADRWGKEFAPLKTISDVLDATEATAAQWEKKAEDADRDWAALTAEQDTLMSEIMGDASLHGYDPDTGQLPVGHISKEERARVMAAKATLDARWQRLKTLDANGKHKAVAVYRQVRDYHQQRLQEAINYVRAQLQQKGTIRPDDPLLKSLEALEAMGKRPYFPLMRLGDYYVVGMSPRMQDLEQRFRAKQLQPGEDALREKLRQDPKHYWVEGTARLATAKRLAEKLRKEMGFAQYNAERYKLANARSHVGQDVGKFEQALEGMALDTKTHDALVEMYEQLLISALPEHHNLKRTLHREGIYGWDKNMRAVFAKTAQTGAWALSRMMHVSDLQQAMSELDEMSKTGEPNAQDARALHNELLARQDLTFTRYEDPLLVRGAMKFSYLSMLGFSPAFWAINLTQPWMVTLPYLTARNGNEFKATSSALWRGVREAFSMIESSFEGKELRTQFNPDKVSKQGQKVNLTANERRMLDTLGADGTLDFTIGYDLGAIAKGGSGKWQKVMRTINAPTHATELANRVGTALAAYRISIKGQHSHEQALEFAKKAVSTTQVNYNPANKARYMQAWKETKWLPKLVFQFYTYQQAMAYLALSTLRDAIKGDKVAQSTLAWMTGMLGATGGVFALPFSQMALGAASLIFSALGGGDDEDDVDFQRDLRNLFSDHLPKPVAMLLNKGLGSMLLQTDLGARIGMGNLMNPLAFARFEAADKGADMTKETLFRLGGAPVANVANAVDGLFAMRDVMGALVTGDAPKGSDVNDMFAKLFPLKGVRDIFRGDKLFNEGVTTGEGEPRVTDFSALEAVIQGLGITPLRKTMYYERNAAIQGAKEAMKTARGELIKEYAQAKLAGEPVGAIRAKIGAFNQRNPDNRITTDTLERSLTQRQKDRQSLDNGILANKENRPYLAAGRWAQ